MNGDKRFNIAIDGPAGAGKSTIAKLVARQLGSIYVDTGAMYRAMALFLIRKGVKPPAGSADQEASFRHQVESLCDAAEVSIAWQDGQQVVLLDGENVTSLLRTQEVSDMASMSSTVGKLRQHLVQEQQKLAASRNVVMDGRDIGTVVLPDAQLKIYLTASVEVRAKRRYIENLRAAENGAQKTEQDLDLKAIEQEIADRDHRDMTRAESPLRQAEDAVLVDTSDMTIDQVAETILNLAAERLGRPKVMTARAAGFCFGVQNAVDTVYREIEKVQKEPGPRIVTYGPIIHNTTVVNELKEKGVGIINSAAEAKTLFAESKGTIIIRSHGVSKATYEALEATGAKVVDTTCTFVKNIHRIVEEASRNGEQIVVIGNHGHAETEGTVGWSSTPVAVIETEEEARNYAGDRSKPVRIVAQTTFNVEKFKKFVDLISDNGYNISVSETICNATNERQAEARRIAKAADIMIVIGDRGSSNTAKLYEICREECGRTCFIQTAEELDLTLTGSEKIIGITAGASTPKKIIEEVQSSVRRTDF